MDSVRDAFYVVRIYEKRTALPLRRGTPKPRTNAHGRSIAIRLNR